MNLSILLGLLSAANALLPIVQIDNKFYQVNENYTQPGTEFTLVGVDYQPGGPSDFEVNGKSDVLTDAQACLRDAYVLQQLGVNTIRIYSVSPWLNHDTCMSIFNDAGIYVLLDLNNPYQSIHRKNPKKSYDEGYLNNVFGLIDAFKYYPNLLGFFAGNEVVNEDSDDDVIKYVRAVQRDVKEYISLHANRTIPVGYSAASIAKYRYTVFDYLQCGDEKSAADFYALNSYDWCGNNDWESSGYQTFKDKFENSSIPIFFSEYGCNKPRPREFKEVTEGLYARDGLRSVFSGGLVYEYSEEDNKYGLVKINRNGSITYQPDFDNLRKQFANITLNNQTQPRNASSRRPSCRSLNVTKYTDLPDTPASRMLKNGGGNNNVGRIVDISRVTRKYKVFDKDGREQNYSLRLTNTVNWQYNVPRTTRSSSSRATTTRRSSSTATATGRRNNFAMEEESAAAASTTAAEASSTQNNAVATGAPIAAALAAAAGLVLM